MIISLADYGLGTVFQITDDKKAKGLVGWDFKVIKSNMWPDYRYDENFYTVLAVFFPMVTGIFAGSGMSGDLKDPSTAIPKYLNNDLSSFIIINYNLFIIFFFS